MSTFKSLCMVAAFSLCAPVAATASTVLETQTVFFGSKADGLGIVNQKIVNGTPEATGWVGRREDNGQIFREEIIFSSNLSTFNIDKFVITLNVAGVDPLPVDGVDASGAAATPDDDTLGRENWFAEIVGSTSSANESFWKRLAPNATSITFELSALNDINENGSDRIDGTANTAFARSVAANRISLRFKEMSGWYDDAFTLFSATVEVREVSSQELPAPPVPLPASGLLLLGAVGGMAAWRRRKAA